MKEKFESKFQDMIRSAYGSQMISREQMSQLRTAFSCGLFFGYTSTINVAAEIKDDGTEESLQPMEDLKNAMIEYFNKSNK